MATNQVLKSVIPALLISTYTRTHLPTHTRILPLIPSSLSLSVSTTRRHCTVVETTTASDTVVDTAAVVKNAAAILDIRVGKVLKAWRHPDAETLYVEEIDIGENDPRIICSGLVNYVPIEYFQDRKVVVLANLKPRNMRGVKSCGMLMAASDASHENVELLVPPEDSVPGERIWFGSEDEKENQPEAASANQIQKKKVWETVQPHLKTDASCIANLDGCNMMTSAGPVISTSLMNANIA